jgi:transposase InsO family protein
MENVGLLSRKIVGWCLKPNMESELVVGALKMDWFK